MLSIVSLVIFDHTFFIVKIDVNEECGDGGDEDDGIHESPDCKQLATE
jgi:hypothetical protein